MIFPPHVYFLYFKNYTAAEKFGMFLEMINFTNSLFLYSIRKHKNKDRYIYIYMKKRKRENTLSLQKQVIIVTIH